MPKAQTAEPSTAVSVFEAPNALVILTDGEKFDRFYDDVKRETDKLEIDLTTERGRKAIASMAYKVALTKTAIDEAGKTLTAEWREKIGVVDEARRNIRTKLDALKAEVRKPLTDWEEAEAARVDRVETLLSRWRSFGRVEIDDTPDDLMERLEEMAATQIADDEFGGHFDIAVNLRASLMETLAAARERMIKEAADRAELELLRAERAEMAAAEEARKVEEDRKAQEAAAAEKAEMEAAHAAEQAKIDAERLAEERRAFQERIEREATEAAKAAAEKKAADEREELRAVLAEALAAEKKRADEAEAARLAEARKVEAERAAQAAEAKRLADEQAARDADRKHRSEVMAAAKVAIMGYGVGQDAARKIVLAIVAGEVPNVTLRF